MKVQLAIRWTLESWDDCYFWTFTFAEAASWGDITGHWRAIYKRLAAAPMRWPWCGVRVFELHPGGHGVHIHCVTPYYYDIREMRALVGLDADEPLCGIINVKRVKANSRANVAKYVATYLSKWRWATKPPKGTRMWSTFGLLPSQKTRICDISTDGPHKRAWDFIEENNLWHTLMTAFAVEHKRKDYHKLLCLNQLFALPEPVRFLAELLKSYPAAPPVSVDYIEHGREAAFTPS